MLIFLFQDESARLNMRLPKTLLDAVKDRASHQGIPYQRFIRQVLERAVTKGDEEAPQRS